MALSTRQTVELFHLVFLRALIAKGDDKALIAVKGGCNLRFYFGSVRYSEDIDFDVRVIAKETLRNKVERLLQSPLVGTPLKAQGIEVIDVTAPKPTPTTQRWKVGLAHSGSGVPLRTKLEFSRRLALRETRFERVDPELLRPYGLTPFLATHYATAAAISQKIHALADRSEPQARDLFDLNLLFARPDAANIASTAGEKAWLAPAIENATALSFDEYRSKVVAYLDPSQIELYRDRVAWQTMQETVVARLEALR